mgnify:CR=1 FL=1
MKKTNITLSIALAAVFSSSMAFAEAEVTGKIVHESAKFTTSGTTIGAAAAHGKDVMKTETSARIYIDGEIDEVNEGSTYHVELNLMRDSKGVGKHDGNESYTQRDALREAYVDTTVEDWSIRAGKQQVVWGTADGMKLLDMINPSDYSEMAQNQMEDSRIPVWMVNAETTNADGSEFQVVVSQPRENVFAGLDRNVSTAVRSNGTTQLASDWSGTWGTHSMASGASGDGAVATMSVVDATSGGHSQGQAFIMKGVDSITGKTNGFLNIAPDLGSVATRFYNQFCQTGCNSLQNANYITVNDFANLTGGVGGEVDTNFGPNYSVMNSFAEAGYDGAAILSGFATGVYDANLTDATSASTFAASGDIDSTFEYMRNATFTTFDTFAGAKSQYVYNMPESTDLDIATRYKNTTPEGMNYSLNYSYNYDKNPIINLSWRDSSTGAELYKRRVAGTSNATFDHTGAARDTTSIELYASAADAVAGTNRYGAYGASGSTAGTPTLRFEQTVKRAHNIGGSFDTAIETEGLGPVVLRGEALYQKDVYSPVMDLTALSIGDLTDSLKMEKGDRFKYVLGADITALTNMMVSVQFIQDRNLDYVDTSSTISGNSAISSLGKYTADYSTMSMGNSFNKAEKDKNFYSLFLSKPFGASAEHRWNNIFMFEENGGKWNRLDAEFSIDDDTQATVEYNKYWGDANTQFGQLEASSNIQVGVKYSF